MPSQICGFVKTNNARGVTCPASTGFVTIFYCGFSREDYYLLSDLLKNTECSRGDFLLRYPVDIKTMASDSLVEEISTSWVNMQINMIICCATDGCNLS